MRMSHGFVPALLPSNEVLGIKTYLSELGVLTNDSLYISDLISIASLDLILPSAICSLASSLLSDPMAKLQSIELHNQPPWSSPIPTHQDNFYHCLSEGTGVKIVLPLQQYSTLNGALHFYNCAADIKTFIHQPSSIKNFSSYIPNDILSRYWFTKTTYAYSVGDASYHYLSSIHSAEGNKTDHLSSFVVYRYYTNKFKIDDIMKSRYEEVYARHCDIIKGL